jgi:ligand-binding sensor domain-containing protein
VHAGRDRLLVDAFAWRRFGESHWHRWTGDELQRYEGRARVDLAHDPWSTPAARATLPPDAPPLPREPRPYLADHDPGWLPASPAPSGLPADSAAVTCALETDDALWIGTTAGLVRFDPAASAYALIGAARGLPTPRIVSVRPSAGYVLVSTIDGVFLLPAS